ncbi:MAG: hypothetical protein QM758_17935 [Armatimonas sp.]
MVYPILLAVGLLGLIAQTVLGHIHDGGDGHAHDGQGHEAHDGHDSHDTSAYLTLLSPLRLFAICLGTGAAGLLLGGIIPTAWLLAIVSLVCGLAFYQFGVRPLLNLARRFESKPAGTLKATVAKEAVADSRFDESGRGIVTVTVDGQLVRLLADLDEPTEVRPGDRLTVTEIDGAKNTCKVTRL